MTRFVLDCSVAMAWCFEDEADDYADEVLDALTAGEALVPVLFPLEVSNALVVAERRRRLSEADARRFMGMLTGLPISLAPPIALSDMPGLAALARHHALSAYDASYLDLAAMAQVPLATGDRRLRGAAEQVGIALWRAG